MTLAGQPEVSNKPTPPENSPQTCYVCGRPLSPPFESAMNWRLRACEDTQCPGAYFLQAGLGKLGRTFLCPVCGDAMHWSHTTRRFYCGRFGRMQGNSPYRCPGRRDANGNDLTDPNQ